MQMINRQDFQFKIRYRKFSCEIIHIDNIKMYLSLLNNSGSCRLNLHRKHFIFELVNEAKRKIYRAFAIENQIFHL